MQISRNDPVITGVCTCLICIRRAGILIPHHLHVIVNDSYQIVDIA